jgi:hypothetical protein
MPDDYLIQVQTALLVTERSWCDFISYSAGLPMFVSRVRPDAAVQAAILDAATKFHTKLSFLYDVYAQHSTGLIKTERKIEQEITI